MCDIAFITSPNWDVSKLCCTSSELQHCVKDETHPLLGSVPLYVYPRLERALESDDSPMSDGSGQGSNNGL